LIPRSWKAMFPISRRTFSSSSCRHVARDLLNEVLIVSAARTPLGSFPGSLSSLTGPQLGSIAIQGALTASKTVLPDNVEEVYMGTVCAAGVGQAPARQAALGAGLPVSTPCTTVNKVCASGMKAIMIASQSIMCGLRDVMIAGGQESMSNVPYYLKREVLKYGGNTLNDGILVDGLTDAYTGLHMGDCAELTISKFGVTREEQDEYALSSYEKSKSSWSNGVFEHEVVPVTVKGKRKGMPSVTVAVDEEFTKLDTDKLVRLRPLFKNDGGGSITFGNSSKINDGAAALLLMSAQASKCHDSKPLARIVSFADAAVDPVEWSVAPALAIPKALQQAGLTLSDISMVEINEAFSSVVIVNNRLLGLDEDIVNIHGGAVSIGHPYGVSGARIVGHLAHNLKPGEYGVAGICNGGGGASAIVIQGI